MQSATFREWLAARGCRFQKYQHEPKGHAVVTVEREGRTAELPSIGSHESLDADLLRDICERLGLDWNELPGPMGRA